LKGPAPRPQQHGGSLASFELQAQSQQEMESDMSVATEALRGLRDQIAAGFLVQDYRVEGGIHHFVLPALEYDHYNISVPDCTEVRSFVASDQFAKARMQPIKLGVALLDLVGFSANPEDVQLRLIVRYQCQVRRAVSGFAISKMISIGDGTIFVFEEAAIGQMPEFLIALDHAIGSFNLDWKWDGVPEIVHRIGVHVGSGYRFLDINGDTNYVGPGVNLAQRVSTCVPDSGEAVDFKLDSPIYVSEAAKREFELGALPEGVQFNDAGIRDVKHGVRIHVHAMVRVTRVP
jgi:hypothetical protein